MLKMIQMSLIAVVAVVIVAGAFVLEEFNQPRKTFTFAAADVKAVTKPAAPSVTVPAAQAAPAPVVTPAPAATPEVKCPHAVQLLNLCHTFKG